MTNDTSRAIGPGGLLVRIASHAGPTSCHGHFAGILGGHKVRPYEISHYGVLDLSRFLLPRLGDERLVWLGRRFLSWCVRNVGRGRRCLPRSPARCLANDCRCDTGQNRLHKRVVEKVSDTATGRAAAGVLVAAAEQPAKQATATAARAPASQ
jgi:hypothetical protein